MMLNLKKITCLTLLLVSPLLFATPSLQAEDKAPLRIICFGAHPDDAEYKNRRHSRTLGAARTQSKTGLRNQW